MFARVTWQMFDNFTKVALAWKSPSSSIVVIHYYSRRDLLSSSSLTLPSLSIWLKRWFNVVVGILKGKQFFLETVANFICIKCKQEGEERELFLVYHSFILINSYLFIFTFFFRLPSVLQIWQTDTYEIETRILCSAEKLHSIFFGKCTQWS